MCEDAQQPPPQKELRYFSDESLPTARQAPQTQSECLNGQFTIPVDDYLNVYELRKNVPRLLAWLESRSRADGGLVLVLIIHIHELQLDFADSERRAGDWSSERLIRARYNCRDGQFLETGTREKSDLKNTHSPIRVPALLINQGKKDAGRKPCAMRLQHIPHCDRNSRFSRRNGQKGAASVAARARSELGPATRALSGPRLSAGR